VSGAGQATTVSESVRGTPAAPLRGLLAWYSGYRQAGVPPARHRGLPSPYLTLIITLDEPLTVARHPSAWLAEEFRNVQASAAPRMERGEHDRQQPATSGVADPAGP
jgi:hypothetical protein